MISSEQWAKADDIMTAAGSDTVEKHKNVYIKMNELEGLLNMNDLS